MNTINQLGLAAIIEFLVREHVRGESMTVANISAWATEAEQSMHAGNPPLIEIDAHNSVMGVPTTFTVPDWGVDHEEI